MGFFLIYFFKNHVILKGEHSHFSIHFFGIAKGEHTAKRRERSVLIVFALRVTNSVVM